MKKFIYILVFILVLSLDRFTKIIALKNGFNQYSSRFLSFDLAINRGISWGFLHSSANLYFYILNCLIVLLIIFLMVLAGQKLKKSQFILGEVFVLAGAISNLIDRYLYAGVIDFILLSIKGYSWPLFNLADAFILIGAVIMYFSGQND